ncbi:hypothetical protein [Planomicrobium sp. CPCC 101110]|uniref:hypothetical protein n=1 Tax=Planomicrobium sp. CPCC 101110 TaxID=2599619 RepID=UPI0011B766BB|nr:hypothetical protein [Planomicrobium sp. CPCC 101110]TWT25757.1 hypothetical protein FQV30_08100 [Planomicrobium sp. CPCC 101110]
MDNKNEFFSYTYSGKQQEEIKHIIKKYAPLEENKMTQLKKLDKRAERPGMIAALIIGLMGSVLLGLGLCCILIWSDLFALGVAIGVIGIASMAAAYPVYTKMTMKRREKLAPQIMELSNELMNQK